MARIIFVTGGCRSGKSDYALKEAERFARKTGASRIFVATCPSIDAEMDERIARHRRARDPGLWETVEEEVALEGALNALAGPSEKAVVVDCLSLWVNNLMYRQGPRGLEEAEVSEKTSAILVAARKIKGAVFFVSNEVGLGLVPENAEGRRYRDLLGRVNQTLAMGADEALLLVSGLSLKLSPG